MLFIFLYVHANTIKPNYATYYLTQYTKSLHLTTNNNHTTHNTLHQFLINTITLALLHLLYYRKFTGSHLCIRIMNNTVPDVATISF